MSTAHRPPRILRPAVLAGCVLVLAAGAVAFGRAVTRVRESAQRASDT